MREAPRHAAAHAEETPTVSAPSGWRQRQVEVQEHILVYLFPSISRCPYKDHFHAINLCTKTLVDGTPEGKSEFSSEVGGILCQVCASDVDNAATEAFSNGLSCLDKLAHDMPYSPLGLDACVIYIHRQSAFMNGVSKT